MSLLPPSAAVAALALLAGCSGPAPSTSAPAPPPPPTSPPPTAPGPRVLLALGDSVAFGTGAPAPARNGYVPLLAERLPGPDLEVRNLATPGATTGSVLRTQLPRARELLQERAVGLVTLTVGGNDVFVPVLQACGGDPAAGGCRTSVQSALAAVSDGLDRVLGALEGAVGPGTPVAVMAYYDPLPACRLAELAPLSRRVLEGAGSEPGLNDVLRDRAAEHGALVVETADRVTGAGLVGGDDCLHPSGQGHERIADAFLDVVGDRLS